MASDPTVLNTSCNLFITGIRASIVQFQIIKPVDFQKYRLQNYIKYLYIIIQVNYTTISKPFTFPRTNTIKLNSILD